MSSSRRALRPFLIYFDPGLEPALEEADDGMDTEVTMDGSGPGADTRDVMQHDSVSNIEENRIIIAIDFGTTFSSVAYATLPKGVPPDQIDIRQVNCIGNYPGYVPPHGAPDTRQDVPSELWYDDGNTESALLQTSDDEGWSSDETLPDIKRSESPEYCARDADAAEINKKKNLKPSTQYWGFSVQEQLSMMDIPRDEAMPLTRFKLALDQTQETEKVRTEVKTILKSLMKRKIIERDTDIYAHYLTQLLRHTKSQLALSRQFKEDMVVQFVLCVPAKWPTHACRIMQNALEEAVITAGLSGKGSESVHNIFMISEPEAAAECILAESRSELYQNESVVILDAGGGTIDAVTYKCEKDEPLRLSAEVVAPDSKLCGASYINERFEQKLLQKLSKEKYLIKNGKTLKSIVQASSYNFENDKKRKLDVNDERSPVITIYIDDLRQNIKKDFRQNRLKLKKTTVKGFYDPALKGAQQVLEDQLVLSKSQGHFVQKVILTGGFGQSPSLQSSLRNYLGGEEFGEQEIELIVPENPSTAVARGAVLRALNKRFGPSRITQCSYGFLITEVHEPNEVKAHKGKKPRINRFDGEKHVHGTIRWIVQAGSRVENIQVFSANVKETFAITKKRLQCSEQLWMSDFNHPSHYRRTHPMNKGAMAIGEITVDLTFLVKENLIQPTVPLDYNNHSRKMKPYWEAHYELAMIVEGRSIRFEARWPTKENLKWGEVQRILDMKLVGIAAAFKPGTA